jgi:hypothetical protein
LGFSCSKDYPGCESSSTSSESDSPAAVNKESRVRKLPLHHWDDMEEETIDRLPEDIDGTKVYVINGFTKNKDALKLLKDGRRGRKTAQQIGKGTDELDTLTVKARVSVRMKTVPIRYSMVSSIEPSLKKGAERIPPLSAKDAGMFQNLSAMKANL